MTSIPKFFASANLNIKSASVTSQNNGTLQQLTAQDPEGDRVTISSFTEDTGNMMVMPETKLTALFQKKGSEAGEPVNLSSDDAYKLASGLEEASDKQGLQGADDYNYNMNLNAMSFQGSSAGNSVDAIDTEVVGELLAELSEKGGLGGANLMM